jgi:hypothetical protein
MERGVLIHMSIFRREMAENKKAPGKTGAFFNPFLII